MPFIVLLLAPPFPPNASSPPTAKAETLSGRPTEGFAEMQAREGRAASAGRGEGVKLGKTGRGHYYFSFFLSFLGVCHHAPGRSGTGRNFFLSAEKPRGPGSTFSDLQVLLKVLVPFNEVCESEKAFPGRSPTQLSSVFFPEWESGRERQTLAWNGCSTIGQMPRVWSHAVGMSSCGAWERVGLQMSLLSLHFLPLLGKQSIVSLL